ncbi:MAG: YrbL family protein [Desulfocapsaceae bacterium]
MIDLSKAKLIGSGLDRVVYQDPTYPQRCLKLARPDVEQKIESIHDRLFWLARGCDTRFIDYNFVDVLYANFLQRKNNQHAFDHSPQCFGFVDTTRGTGVAWELIQNHDGTPCNTLIDCYHNPGLLGPNESSLLRAALDVFFAWMLEHHILLREMASSNTLIRKNEDDSLRLYHIDAIGCVDIIPLALYFNWIAQLRIRSKIFRFKKKLTWIK